MNAMKRFPWLALMIAGAWLSLAAPAWAGAVLADIENALMCKCDDKCGKVLINCTCDTSHKTRRELQKQLDSGLTKEQIIKSYVDKFGETILSAPTKTGFNLTAWLTPFAALVGGGLGVRQIIKAWLRKRSGEDAEQPRESAAPSSPYAGQLQKELDKLEL